MAPTNKIRARLVAGKGELLAQQLAANRIFRENETTETAPLPRHIIDIEDVTHGLGLDAADEQEVQRLILDTNAHFDQTTQTHRLTTARGRFVTTLRAMPHISSDIRMELTKRVIAYWRRNTQTDYGKPPTIRSIAVKSEPTLVIKAAKRLNGSETRLSMPQIVAKKLPAFLKELREDGTKVKRATVDPKTLKPTQNKLDTAKVDKLKKLPEALKKPILVSKDGFILDGHHRWAANKALKRQQPVIQVQLDRDDLLEEARDFDGAEFRKAGAYIGPRGGKWADAKHTIPWKDPDLERKRTALIEIESSLAAATRSATRSLDSRDDDAMRAAGHDVRKVRERFARVTGARDIHAKTPGAVGKQYRTLDKRIAGLEAELRSTPSKQMEAAATKSIRTELASDTRDEQYRTQDAEFIRGDGSVDTEALYMDTARGLRGLRMLPERANLAWLRKLVQKEAALHERNVTKPLSRQPKKPRKSAVISAAIKRVELEEQHAESAEAKAAATKQLKSLWREFARSGAGYKPGKGNVRKADKIPGGLADKKKPSDFDPKKLAAGVKIEMEHTSDRAIAAEIAMDHLTEDAGYYEKLETIEKASKPPAGYVPAPGSKKGAYRKKVGGKWDHWYPDAKKPKRKAKKKPAREPHINGWAGVVGSELGDHLRGILVRYGNLEALQQELKETLDPEKQKELTQGIANYRVNEMTGIPSKAETHKLLVQSMKLRTFDDVQKFTETPVDLGDHKIQVINWLGNSLGWAIRAPGAPPKKGDDGYAQYQKLVKKVKAFEQDTAWRRPKSTDPQEVADTYNLAMIDINPTLPEPIQTHITGMLSNAFEDLADVLGAVKLSHGSLQIRVTAQEALYAPGYAYGAQYVRPRSRNPEDWDRDWNFGDSKTILDTPAETLKEQMDQAPPMIRISMERGSALAHEYGHALDDATAIISATPKMREQHADEIEAKEAVHMLLLQSPMRARAERVERKLGPRGYWGSPAEMWARGFEQYVHKKLNDKGRLNTLLTHHTYDGRVTDGVFMSPKEFAPIEAAFDKWLVMVKELGMLEKAFRLLFGEPTLIVKARSILTPNIQVGEARGAPRFDMPPMPDYQSIYYPPENAPSHKQEREQSQNRRRADAERARGKWGFHGKVIPDKPVIRWKMDREQSEDPFEHTGVKQEHKPRKSPKLMARDRLKAGVTTYPDADTELPGEGKRKRKRKKKKKQVRLTARKQ